MNKNLPFFSIITATHLRAPLLRRALQSLRAQTFQDFEIIVIADAMDADTGAVVAELFSRTFYRNGHEIGLPLLEAPGVHALVEDGDRLRVDVRAGTLENLTSGKTLQSKAPSAFLLEMLESGGLIPLLKSGTAGLLPKGIQ